MLEELLWVVVLMTLLDRLGLLGLQYWLETFVDFTSVQATMFHGELWQFQESAQGDVLLLCVPC